MNSTLVWIFTPLNCRVIIICVRADHQRESLFCVMARLMKLLHPPGHLYEVLISDPHWALILDPPGSRIPWMLILELKTDPVLLSLDRFVSSHKKYSLVSLVSVALPRIGYAYTFKLSLTWHLWIFYCIHDKNTSFVWEAPFDECINVNWLCGRI